MRGKELLLTPRSPWTGFHSERCKLCTLGTPSGSPWPTPWNTCRVREKQRLERDWEAFGKAIKFKVQSSKKRKNSRRTGLLSGPFVFVKTDELFNLPLVWQENNAGVKKFQWVEPAAGLECCHQTERGYQSGILTH